MYFFAVAFGLVLHVLFWGVGLAVLAMPHPWRRFWPVLAGPAGLALQTLVVWLGAYADLPGTNRYAWWSETVPLALLALAIWKRGGLNLGMDLRRLNAVWLTMAACIGALVFLLARASRGLTTMSLGSCDAADYAGGARVLMEFTHSERGGFLGLTEVVSVMSVDNFFDYWLRLNHFSPAALIALNGSLFNCLPHELTSVMTMVLLVTTLPLVFWMARAVMGYRANVAVWLTVLYGFGPVTWYAVFHVAMGQLIAAQAIALLTWAGIALWRGALSVQRALTFGGVLTIGYSLLLSGYNFFLLVCLVPALAYVGGVAFWRRQWARLGRWTLLMVAPLVVSGAIFAERVIGLKERFLLFQAYDFGWRIPALSPEGWLGMVKGEGLEPFPGWVRIALSAVVVLALGLALVQAMSRRRRKVYVALSLILPALVGYAYLNWRGMRLGTNASYDAYKVFAVFYPGLLVAVCYWVTLADSRIAALRWAGRMLGLVVTGFTLNTTFRFADRMETPPLIVNRELLQVSEVEAMSDVASVNLLLPDMWSRLWTNALVLRKPQFFFYHTYEARRNTPLRGEWDLNGGLLQVRLPDEKSRRLNPHFTLVDTRSPYFLRARLTSEDGWYDLERNSRAPERWRWTKEAALIRFENPQPHPLQITCRLEGVHSLVERDLQIWVGGKLLTTVWVRGDTPSIRVPRTTIPAGGTIMEFRTSTPLTAPGGGDTRLLGFRIFGIEIEVLKDPQPVPSE